MVTEVRVCLGFSFQKVGVHGGKDSLVAAWTHDGQSRKLGAEGPHLEPQARSRERENWGWHVKPPSDILFSSKAAPPKPAQTTPTKNRVFKHWRPCWKSPSNQPDCLTQNAELIFWTYFHVTVFTGHRAWPWTRLRSQATSLSIVSRK